MMIQYRLLYSQQGGLKGFKLVSLIFNHFQAYTFCYMPGMNLWIFSLEQNCLHNSLCNLTLQLHIEYVAYVLPEEAGVYWQSLNASWKRTAYYL